MHVLTTKTAVFISCFCYLFLLLLLFNQTTETAAAAAAAAKETKFKCDLAVFERCVNTLLVHADESFVYPTNMREMNATCK